MTEAYRPTRDQLHLFAALAKEIRAEPNAYLTAASWFQTEFSFASIDARKEAELLPLERTLRDLEASRGWVKHERSDASGFMERLLRATEWLVEIDDSALPKADRVEHHRRVILIATLMTDPDFYEDVPVLAKALKMDRAHWPTAKALTVSAEGEVVLDRWWARDMVFDLRFSKWPFEPLIERALESVRVAPPAPREPANPDAARSEHEEPPPPSPTPPTEERCFLAAELGDSDRGVLLSLELARRRTPPEALTAAEIKRLAEDRKFTSFRDADHVRRTVYSLRDRTWPIPNAMNGTGYRLGKSLNDLCPELARVLDAPASTDNQSSSN